jgi:hypothetical protein
VTRTVEERFWVKVDQSGDCWMWTGCIDRYGYGKLRGASSAHRLAYEIAVGPIPSGLVIDHICRVRSCVNPAHLEAVSMRENTLRGDTLAARNLGKTHCDKGHPFDEENTYIEWNKYGNPSRRCRTCNRFNESKLRRTS